MLRIDCPYCGERDFNEFTYSGDASTKIPDLADSNTDHWTDYVMFRDNPMGSHTEYWQHQSGCRQWLRVVRNTMTHVIDSVTPAREVSWPTDSPEIEK